MTASGSKYIEQIMNQREAAAIWVFYTNHRGESSQRHIYPLLVRWGRTEHHPNPQWLLECWDLDRKDRRTYTLKDCDFKTGGDFSG